MHNVENIQRKIALEVLLDVETKGAYSNISLDNAFKRHILSNTQKSFITRLVYETILWKLKLDHIYTQFFNKSSKKTPFVVTQILRMGVCQIFMFNSVPDSAVCNTCVDLTKELNFAGYSGFVNGVLRNICRNKDNIKYPKKEDGILEYYSIKYSWPIELIKEIIKERGEEFLEKYLKASSLPPQNYLRVNTLKTTSKEMKEKLNTTEYLFDNCLKIDDMYELKKNNILEDGLGYLQDPASMLVVKTLKPESNSYIIDVCAAPGGKTTHIAQLVNNTGEISARDINDKKLNQLNLMSKRLGVTNVKTLKLNGKDLRSEDIGKADYILLDAPCSGLGVIRRKPEIKYRITIENILSLSIIQKEILEKVVRYLKPNGVLVYSTCTITKKENEVIVKSFISDNNDYTFDPIPSDIPIDESERSRGYSYIFPHEYDMDGFFIARIRRKDGRE